MDTFFNKELPDREMVTEWLNEAAYSQNNTEKLELFHKVQEYLLRKTPGLLMEFLQNVLNFTMDKNADVKRALVGFIEEACKINENILPKVTLNLHMLLVDSSIPVQKRVIQAAITIYRKMLSWICRASNITEEMEKAWKDLTMIKSEIVNLIDSDNDGVRTSAVKFLECVVLLQSYPDPADTKSSDFSLEDVPLTLKIARRRKLEEESKNIFSLLVNFNISSHISSANLFACVGALTNIGKNRPEYMVQVIEAIVKLHANMPPTLSTMQVNSVRKKLKSELTSLIKHPAAYEYVDVISSMLLELGCSQQEVSKMTPKAEDRRRYAKRQAAAAAAEPSASKKPRLDDKELDTFDKQKLSMEANEAFILDNLNKHLALQMVLKGLYNIPDTMPETFPTDYLAAQKSGPTGHMKTISKLLAPQFTEAGVGPGVKFIGKCKLVKESEPENLDPKKPEEEEVAPVPEKEKPKAPKERLKTPRVRTLKLNEVTRPLDKSTKQNLLLGAVQRLLAADKKGSLAIRQKIITTVAASFSESVRQSVLSYLLYDLKGNLDLALSWLYEEYSIMQGFLRIPELRKEGRIDQNYNTLLSSFVTTASSDAIILSRLLLEAPMVTEIVLDQLCIICQDEQRCHWAMGLLRDLILRRPTRQSMYLCSLLIHTTHDSQIVRDIALGHMLDLYGKADSHNKDVHGKSNFQEDIETFVTKYLEYLQDASPPVSLFGHNQGRLMPYDDWSEDTMKACLLPYITLLPVKGELIHRLAKVYVQAEAEVKRMILKLLETPIRQMGMENAQLLKVVEECPKGSETLVTRVIQILTDKGPPSEELVQRVRDLYHSRVSDVRFLIPVLNGLSKKEVIMALPKLIKLSPVVVREVFNRLLGAHGESPITPTELLVQLHIIDPAKADLKTTMKATSMCLQEKQAYTQEVLAVVLQQLMDQTPLPTLLMRTVIQALSSYPRLSGFVMNILQRLILKQVWKQKVVWEGFIKCCQRTQPQSFAVLMQLPGSQLKEALEMSPDLKDPLRDHLLSFSENQRAHVPSQIQDILLGNAPPALKLEPVPPPIITNEMMPPPAAPLPVPPPVILSEPLPPGME